MRKYIAYENDRILYTCEVDEATAAAILESGVNLIQGDVDPNTNYMPDGAPIPVPRPESPARLMGSRIVSIPAPATVYIGSSQYKCTDTVIDLEFDQPGTYHIRIECWPYLDKEFTYENKAQ